MGARIGRYVKRMKTVMKAYKFYHKHPIIALSFVAKFKRACDFDEVSDGMALWKMPSFMKDRPESSFTARMTSRGDVQGKLFFQKLAKSIPKHIQGVRK